MARRASSSINAPAIVGIIAALLLIAGGGLFALRGKKESFADTAALRMAEFMDNGNSMRGMAYRVEGTVQSRYPRDGGLGLSVEISNEGTTDYLFIVVPKKLEQMNIERDQPYAFKVRFEEGGIAVATDVERL